MHQIEGKYLTNHKNPATSLNQTPHPFLTSRQNGEANHADASLAFSYLIFHPKTKKTLISQSPLATPSNVR